jgi:hypothetical protein
MFTDCASETQGSLSEQGLSAVTHVLAEAVADIALLSNSSKYNDDGNYDSLIELNSHDMAFIDFATCFYSQQGGNFNVSNLNKSFKPLLLHHQTYKTTDNKNFVWNLNQQCLKAYSNKHKISENNISTAKKIDLAKEVFGNQSLATNTGFQTALAWDQVINNLETNGDIVYTGDSDHNAKIVFRIFYVFYSKGLDVKVAAVFKYKTDVPCYRNVYNNTDHYIPNPYSQAEDRKVANERKSEGFKAKTKLNSKYFDADDNSTIASLMTRNILSTINDDDYDDDDDDDEGNW